jgi:hypothetical protein
VIFRTQSYYIKVHGLISKKVDFNVEKYFSLSAFLHSKKKKKKKPLKGSYFAPCPKSRSSYKLYLLVFGLVSKFLTLTATGM